MVAAFRRGVLIAGLWLPLSACGLPGAVDPGQAVPGLQERVHLTSDRWRRTPGGEVLSDVLTSREPFRELLASWNVNPPRGGGFHVEVRVAPAGEDEDWSPWLCVGRWAEQHPIQSATPTSVACVTEWSGGRINVDVLVAQEGQGRAQLRVRGALSSASPDSGSQARAATGSELEVRRLDVCFTAAREPQTERMGEPHAARAAHGAVRLIGVPRRSQHAERGDLAARLCSPTSLSMVMEYFGVSVPTARVASLAYDPVHDIYGNWPRAIQAAWTLGVPGYVTRFESWSEVEALVGCGLPVILSIAAGLDELSGAPYRQTSGHLLVVVGFDFHGDVIVHDPAAPGVGSVERIYDRRELGRAWLGHGGTAYVLGTSRGERWSETP